MAQKGGPCYRGQQLLDNAPCQAAVNLGSGALPFSDRVSFARSAWASPARQCLSPWERWHRAAMTERASPSPESRHAAISCLFGRAMLSLCLLFSVSVLALSGAPRQLSQRESLWQRGQALRDAKASPFGRGGIAQAMTERASPSPESRHAAISRFFERAKLCPNFSIHAGKRAIRAGFIDFFPADVVYSKQPDILRSHHFFSPFKGGFCMLSYRKLAMRVLGRPIHTGGGYRFAPSSLSAGSSVYPDCRNAHHPYRPGFCRDMVHREW